MLREAPASPPIMSQGSYLRVSSFPRRAHPRRHHRVVFSPSPLPSSIPLSLSCSRSLVSHPQPDRQLFYSAPYLLPHLSFSLSSSLCSFSCLLLYSLVFELVFIPKHLECVYSHIKIYTYIHDIHTYIHVLYII